MEPSLFLDWVEQYFPNLVLSITETINGENQEPPYYHRRFLGRQWSLTGRWENIDVSGSRVMADVIALDSSIPLKKRAPISTATGEIPKVAMEMALNESQLTELQMMVRANMSETRIIESLFRDTASVIRGQYERVEYMFLRGLSSGVIAINSDGPAINNVGVGVRVDFQYRADHQFFASTPWTDPLATPFTDLLPMYQKSVTDGNPIRVLLVDRPTFTAIANSDEAKALWAQTSNLLDVPQFAPTQEQLNNATRANYGYTFEIVERSCRFQIDGVDTDVNPWEAGQVIGINNSNLGSLVWADLAEMNAPVAGVTYQRADEFILASKYRLNRPSLKEITASQSRSLPVIAALNQIYKLDSTQAAGS